VLALPSAAGAQVLRVDDLNTRQIRALDRSTTVVILQGGMLEEHGPYLPAYTDGYFSARLADEVANGVVAQKPGWTALLFPPISAGASGSNEIGKQYSFPGTYAIRPSTLRATYMDLAAELGDQGFKWILVVNVHGSPLHIGAIDDAGDWFRDTYKGTMVNLWGLLPVLAGWGGAMTDLPDSAKKADGLSLHGGLDEHSMMLFLNPRLVSPDYRTAPDVAGASYDSAFAVARRPGWPGYLGSPRMATTETGRKIWLGFSGAAVKTSVEVLNGADPAKYARYLTYLKTLPLYQDWIRTSESRDSVAGAQQKEWRAKRP
jgi:creatinine amidohydrolase/Fe(II)-dependent formamide hydrolase-like protein